MAASEAPQEIQIFGAKLTLADKASLLEHIVMWVESDQHVVVLSGNAYAYNCVVEHGWLREFYNQADWVRIDGVGVRMAAFALGHPAPHRMTWADFIWDLLDVCESQNLSIYFLGARPGIAETAAQVASQHYPNLRIVGTQHGYFDKRKTSSENQAVVNHINEVRPDILLIGFGMPLQEQWLSENWPDIDAHVAMSVGALFDYVSGELQRAPRWMTDNGLEWLGRLIIEPQRLWRRYVLGIPVFLWRVLKQRFNLL